MTPTDTQRQAVEAENEYYADSGRPFPGYETAVRYSYTHGHSDLVSALSPEDFHSFMSSARRAVNREEGRLPKPKAEQRYHPMAAQLDL